MKKNYYKLNLKGSYFWQSKDCIYTKRDYESINPLLDDVYFRKLNDNTYSEVTTNECIVLDQNSNTNFIYPRGVIIDTSKLTPVTSEEVLDRYNQIKHNNLNKQYVKLLTEFLVNSHYCEIASEKKLSRTK